MTNNNTNFALAKARGQTFLVQLWLKKNRKNKIKLWNIVRQMGV